MSYRGHGIVHGPESTRVHCHAPHHRHMHIAADQVGAASRTEQLTLAPLLLTICSSRFP